VARSSDSSIRSAWPPCQACGGPARTGAVPWMRVAAGVIVTGVLRSAECSAAARGWLASAGGGAGRVAEAVLRCQSDAYSMQLSVTSRCHLTFAKAVRRTVRRTCVRKLEGLKHTCICI
jgi:hypothetical protein